MGTGEEDMSVDRRNIRATIATRHWAGVSKLPIAESHTCERVIGTQPRHTSACGHTVVSHHPAVLC